MSGPMALGCVARAWEGVSLEFQCGTMQLPLGIAAGSREVYQSPFQSQCMEATLLACQLSPV